MELRRWTEELAVGFEELDRQHQELFELLNNLNRFPNDLAEALSTLNRFGDAMFDHFAGEERFMAAMGYSELNHHRMRHQSFARLFARTLMSVQSQEPWSQALAQAQDALGDWLATEIHDVDIHLGEFLARNLAPSAS